MEGGFGPSDGGGLCVPIHKLHMEWTHYEYTNLWRAIPKGLNQHIHHEHEDGGWMWMLMVQLRVHF